MIEISGLKLDGNLVPVPVGLSELLSGLWIDKRAPRKDNGYDRETIKRGNQFVTILTKKGG